MSVAIYAILLLLGFIVGSFVAGVIGYFLGNAIVATVERIERWQNRRWLRQWQRENGIPVR